MSPICSKRFFAGRKARSATLRTITRVLRDLSLGCQGQAQLWAPGRDLHAPPAHQHSEQAEARLGVPVLAARLADVVVRHPLPLVTRRVGDQRLDSNPLLLLAGCPLAERAPDVLDPAGQLVAERLEVPAAEYTGAPGRADLPVQGLAGPGLGEHRRQLALELRDLIAKRAPGGAVVDLDPLRKQCGR